MSSTPTPRNDSELGGKAWRGSSEGGHVPVHGHVRVCACACVHLGGLGER